MRVSKSEKQSFVKRIICLVIAIMMLLSSLITPIRSVALTIDDYKELDNSIKPTTKEDIEELKTNGKYKTKNDQYEIREFSMESVGGLIGYPSSSAEGYEFTFRVIYALSGLGKLPAGAVQITMPKRIIRNRDGNLDDNLIMSLSQSSEIFVKGEFVFKEDGDYIVAYNRVPVDAGLNGYFDLSYATKSNTFSYKDYDPNNLGLVTDGGTASDPTYAIMTLNVGDDTLNSITDDKNVYLDTKAKITSTQKRLPKLYREWDSSWMEEIPDDSDEYYYLVWEIASTISKPTQKYNFTLNDFVTDLTEGTEAGDYELVGYKLEGKKYYSNENTVYNQTKENRYDYVLTRHKKSVYDGKAYTLKNNVTATVDPIDQVDEDTSASSSNTFTWNPSFVPPRGHFYLFKYGNNNWKEYSAFDWDYASYDLEKLQNEEADELKGFRYVTITHGYPYPWTLREGGSSTNPEDYGANNVKYETWDDTLYLEDDETPMNSSDYYLEKLFFYSRNLDVEYDDFAKEFNIIDVVYGNDEVITFYAKFGDRNTEEGNVWKEIGTYNLKTQAITKNSEYVQEMTDHSIIFKNGVDATGWKCETSNKHYYSNIEVMPYFVLTSSEYVNEKIANKDSIKIQNLVSTNISDYKNNTIFELTTSAFDYARVTYRDSFIKKEIIGASNKTALKRYEISWRVEAREKMLSGTAESENVQQSSGKFYDLIPLGGLIDLNTIQIGTDKEMLQENQYSYEIIPNYKNSGRSMLVITIDVPAKQYNLFYKTYHTWDSIKDYGVEVLNPVAYETGNDDIGNGFADNGGNLSQPNKALFYDLDDSTDSKKFIYAEESHNINAITSAVSGLNKTVKNATDTFYTSSTNVKPSETYAYKLRFENTITNSSKNLVFFDSLENFKIVDSEAGTTKTSGWKGKLKAVDLSALQDRMIDVGVYISTVEDLDLENNHDLTDSSIWTKVDENDDLSQATAIAIDISKKVDGSDYVLPAGGAVAVVLYVEAPDHMTEEIEQNPYTYNNIYLQNTLIDKYNGTQDYFIHQDYTQVFYRVSADVKFYKVNARDKSEGIRNVVFWLHGTSIYGNEISRYDPSGNDGKVIMRGVPAGEYILQEYSTTEDWVEDHTEHTVVINRDQTVYIDGVLVTEDNIPVITNEPRIHIDVSFYKKDIVDKNRTLQGVKFKLSGISDYGNETLQYAMSDSDGKVTFEDIEKGKYIVEEISTIDGYILSNNKYSIQIDNFGNYLVSGENVDQQRDGQFNIYNEPYHNFYFTKVDSYNEEKLGGAKFRLHGVSDIGNAYDETATSIEGTGIVNFENLESGTYVLEEIEAPNTDEVTYVLDKNKYVLEVSNTGRVTLDGTVLWPLSERNDEPYKWYNTRNKGQITVTKKWVDNVTDDSERREPVIYISTKAPTVREKKAYFRTASQSNSIISYVSVNENVTSFERNITLTEEQVKAKAGVTRLDSDYANENTNFKIYGWVEDGNLYWWSKADVAVLPENLDYYFNNESSLKDINWTGIKAGEYWTGSVGNETSTESITNMKNIFYGCTSIENLDISGFNNSAIENAEDMEYAFGNNGETPEGSTTGLKFITVGENFKLFDTSVLPEGKWINQNTYEESENTSLIGVIPAGTYEFIAPQHGQEMKYAFRIYGINQDIGENGETLGLTFGTATTHITHSYEDTGSGDYYVVIEYHSTGSDGEDTISRTEYLTNSSGEKVTRTLEEKEKYDINLHDMTWGQIAAQSKEDPTVFRDCMLCGDSKGINFYLNDTISSGSGGSSIGDGFGMIYNKIKSEYQRWNPSRSQNLAATNGGTSGSNAREAGGYATSHIRATLIGADNSNPDVTYAGDVNLTSETCIYSCMDNSVTKYIVPKQVKILTGSNESETQVSTVVDPIWLFSAAELNIADDGVYEAEGIRGSTTGAYQIFGDEESKYYGSIPAFSPEYPYPYYGWTRTIDLTRTTSAKSFRGGSSYYNTSCSSGDGIPIGFCFE